MRVTDTRLNILVCFFFPIIITKQIVQALGGNVALNDLNEGVKPGNSTVFDSYGSTTYKASQYKEDLKKFQKLALMVSQEQTFSEGSGPSSDFSRHPSTSSSGQQTTQEI